MESFCIKSNNTKIINYLLSNIDNIDLEKVYYSHNHFKIYENVIIHYKGDNISEFYNSLCEILTNCIITFYEEKIIKKMLQFNYFYFDQLELEQIYNNLIELIKHDNGIERKELVWTPVLKYIIDNKYFILDGFVHFRLSEYHKYLDNIIDFAINQYVIEKEYLEFISLLKLYINSKNAETGLIHLVYNHGESILLDSNKNLINIHDDIFDTKFLSDISFSSNDYALNSLLTLLPNKIIIHLIGDKDEFLNTLNLIFEDRIIFCNNCSICSIYKKYQPKTKISKR